MLRSWREHVSCDALLYIKNQTAEWGLVYFYNTVFSVVCRHHDLISYRVQAVQGPRVRQ